MNKSTGLHKVYPNRKDYSLLHSLGALGFDTQGLPDNFSIYDNRPIPNQNIFDDRFTPPVRPLPEGCTGESQTFLAGLEDGLTYPPDDFYFATPPGIDGQGRQMRDALDTTVNRGFKKPDGTIGNKRKAYFNVYGAGKIDDCDAARIAIWINQTEKRGVSVASYFYPEFVVPAQGSGGGSNHVGADGIVPVPSYNTSVASMHNWIVTGWKTINGKLYLEALTWQGKQIEYFSREIYNALMAQKFTGAFTLTKTLSDTPIPIGMVVYYDHIVASLVQFIHNLFSV